MWHSIAHNTLRPLPFVRYNRGMSSTLTGAPPRLSRLDRPVDPRPFRIMPRDLIILRQVARFRFLTATQIARLVPGSDQRIGRRIRLLFFHGFLDCPRVQRQQLAHVFEAGNFPLVYGLARAGAQLLAQELTWINPGLDWSTNNRRATAPFLAHTIETADVMIGFDWACGQSDALRLIDHHEMLPLMPVATRELRRRDNPFKLKPSVAIPSERQPVTIAVVPDRLFSLVSASQRSNYALELDRGEMDIESRKVVGKSSIRRKFLGYWNAWNQDLHTDQWGFKSFRVLFVTPAEARLQNMIDALGRVIPGGSNLFLFSTPERLTTAGAIGPAWISGKGEITDLS